MKFYFEVNESKPMEILCQILEEMKIRHTAKRVRNDDGMIMNKIEFDVSRVAGNEIIDKYDSRVKGL